MGDNQSSETYFRSKVGRLDNFKSNSNRLLKSILAPVILNELEHSPRLVNLSEADRIRDNEGAYTVDNGKSWMIISLPQTPETSHWREHILPQQLCHPSLLKLLQLLWHFVQQCRTKYPRNFPMFPLHCTLIFWTLDIRVNRSSP